jgi:tetratricopeptide (TPR) repeat protein
MFSSFSASPAQGLVQQGFALLQQGRVEEAWNVFHRAIQADERNALAHHMAGLIALQAGQLAYGVERLERATALNPHDAAAWSNLGNGLRDQGRAEAALEAYAKALALEPGFVDALNNRGVLQLRIGRLDAALADYDRALTLQSDTAVLHNNRAEVLARMGRRQEALAAYDRAAALDPDNPDIQFSRAGLLAEMGLHEQALQGYGRALALDSASAETLINRSNLLAEMGREAEALADCDRAIELHGDWAKSHANRSDLLRRLDRLEEAEASARRALALAPGEAGALTNLGNALLGQSRLNEALEVYGRAVTAGPEGAGAWVNQGVALQAANRFDAALDAYHRALALRPGYPEARFNIATVHLARGDYGEGWRWYEARRDITRERIVPDLHPDHPAWTGAEPLAGKTLVLVSEQGLGDTLQFCRYAAVAKAAGAKVILEVDPPLVQVLQGAAGADLVVAKGEPLPDFDCHAAMMSLPHLFGTRLDSVPGAPYLAADPAKAAAWAERLGERRRPRVGIVWSGGMRSGRGERVDMGQRRNIPLPLLQPLAGADVDLYSLQKGQPAEGELRALLASDWRGSAITDLSGELHDLSDTAAVIDTLDLVISVCTSVAHLAGGLGKPLWAPICFDGCWRWLRDRADSPWYPSARLFRQPRFNDWAPVAAELAAALEDLAG